MKSILQLLGNPPELMPRSGLHLTPSQRMAEMDKMQRRAWELLQQSPEVYAEFMRRNFKKRAVGEAEMAHQKPSDRG